VYNDAESESRALEAGNTVRQQCRSRPTFVGQSEEMKTESEVYFEKFCRRNDFALSPVSVTSEKTPDYTLTREGQRVIVEVKEILSTAEERESERLLDERGIGNVIDITPGARVRKKIADCSPQIRALTQRRYPGLLVLWEQGLCVGRHTESYHVRVAMCGLEEVIVTVPPIASGQSPSFNGMKHGPKRKLTENANTSISAVAVLCVPERDRMLLQVYHNRFAAIPLEPRLLRSPEVLQFVLRDDPNRTTEWEQVS
jgi:hypothetical protein